MSYHSIIAQKLSNREWLEPLEQNIPADLKSERFGVWVAELREGNTNKFNKAPRSPKTGRKIGANKPELFGTFDEAMKAFRTGNFTGIGLLLSGTGLVGIDIDDYELVFETQPYIKDWLKSAIDAGAYCEYSPSSTGLRIFLRGKLPAEGRKKHNLEIYDTSRFLTVTGHLFNPEKVGA